MCSQPQKSKIKAEKAQKYGIFQQNMCVQLAVQSVSQRNKTPLTRVQAVYAKWFTLTYSTPRGVLPQGTLCLPLGYGI